MFDSTSFDKEIYSQLKLIIDIQRSLINLKSDNIKETGDHILKRKELSKTQEGVSLLANCFIEIADFYPMNVEILSDLFIYLQKSESPSNQLHLLKDCIVSCINSRSELRSSVLFFLRTLFLREAIAIKSIIKEIKSIPFHPESKANYVIQWFYPEIKASYSKIIQNAQKYCYFQVPIEFETNDIDSVIPIMNSGYNPIEIAQVIKNDDIDTFSRIVSQCGDDFNYEQFINPTNFERCPILSQKVKLVQYATFFNSIKIFKFMFLHKVEMEPSLFEYAISGGSLEIIRLLAQKKVDLFVGIPISIKYFQNDILTWILDNYRPTDIDDFESMKYEASSVNNREVSLHPYVYNDDFDDYYQYDADDEVELDENDENDDDDDSEESKSFLKYLDYDSIFDCILESNNLLALFILFNYGMSINARNSVSKKTLLHFAIEKGKFFYVKLLLSNDFTEPFLEDKNGETPLEYCLRYSRKDFFNFMIQHEKVVQKISDESYLRLYRYCEMLHLDDAKKFILERWNFDLLKLSFRDFCDAMTFLPLDLFVNQIEPSLIDLFEQQDFTRFAILVSRVLREKNLNFTGSFYFVEKIQQSKTYGQDFIELCILLSYYKIKKFIKLINYYALYLKYQKEKYAPKNSQDKSFSLSSNNNVINVYFVSPKNFTHLCDISMKYQK